MDGQTDTGPGGVYNSNTDTVFPTVGPVPGQPMPSHQTRSTLLTATQMTPPQSGLPLPPPEPSLPLPTPVLRSPLPPTSVGWYREDRVHDSKFRPRVHDLNKVEQVGKLDNLRLKGLVQGSTMLSEQQVFKIVKSILARMPNSENK